MVVVVEVIVVVLAEEVVLLFIVVVVVVVVVLINDFESPMTREALSASQHTAQIRATHTRNFKPFTLSQQTLFLR